MRLPVVFCFLGALVSGIFKIECREIRVSPDLSIQKAVDDAQPGDTIFLADGRYFEDFHSVRNGEPNARITIRGSRDAIVVGESSSRMIEVTHSYHTLEGFSVSGKKKDGKNKEDYVDKCVFVIGVESPELVREDGVEYESSLDGMIVRDMSISDCGGECLRLRSFVTNAEIVGNKIFGCGRHDFMFPSSSVNGEAIYVGTSSNQWNDGKNSREGPDLSKYIWIHENEIEPQGNECVDVKEGSSDVIVEYNTCSDQRDANSAGLDSRTDDVIFRYNEVVDCEGAGVRIGGHTIDGRTYGKNNEVYGNIFSKTKFSSVKIETGDDHTFCDNQCEDECSSRGKLGKEFTQIEGTCKSVRDTPWVTKIEDTAVKVFQNEITATIKSNDESRCKAAKIAKLSSSQEDSSTKLSEDGHTVTHWSCRGKGSWLSIDLESVSQVTSLKMSFFEGDSRQQYFEIYGDGSPVLRDAASSGKSLGLQTFVLDDPKVLKHVTIFGNGNTNDDWNSISEIDICVENTVSLERTQIESCDTFELPVSEKTSCTSKEVPCSIHVILQKPSYVAELEFEQLEGKSRVQKFDLEVKTTEWEDIGSAEALQGTLHSVDVDVDGVTEVKFTGYETEFASFRLIGC